MTTLDQHNVFLEKFNSWSQDQQRIWLRNIIGPPTRILVGDERDHVWLMLQLVEPFRSSNNQRSITDEYRMNQRLYHVTYMSDGEPIIEEIEDEE